MKNLALIPLALLMTISVSSFADEDKTDSDTQQLTKEQLDKQHRHERHEHRREKRAEMHERFFNKIDTNKDGKIDLNEHLAHAEAHFKKMDADSDGYITPEEGREAAKHMRKKFRKLHKHKLQEKLEGESE